MAGQACTRTRSVSLAITAPCRAALRPVAMSDAVAAALAAALSSADAETREYAASVAAGVLEDAAPGAAAGHTASELAEALGPILEDAGLSSDDVSALCDRLAAAHLGTAPGGGAAASSGEDMLIDLRGIILAFAGKVLMKPCDLALHRGGRYALVGQNGVGKTTLLTRVAAGDIAGFPAALRVVYVQHEVLAQSDEAVADFMRAAGAVAGAAAACGTAEVDAALDAVGFTPALKAARVGQLSGGWRMRLAIARSMLHHVDLLLLDEPTNHLDAGAVAWLRGYLREGLPGVTMLMVSHDADFLSDVCSDVIHFAALRLDFYAGGMAAFRAARPDVVLPTGALAAAAAAAHSGADLQTLDAAGAPAGDGAADGAADDDAAVVAGLAAASAALAAGHIKPFVFPDPGMLDGVKSRNKAILRATDVSYTHPGAAAPVLRHVTARLCLASRVGIVGANGAGKTTLLRLLVGEAPPPAEGCGLLWRHESLRVAYVAQHALHHLEAAQAQTPVAYIQERFARGRDAEDLKKSTLALTPEERVMSEARGGVAAVQGRRLQNKELFYEVRKTGRPEKDNSWEPLSFLSKMPPYVMKLVRDYDERLKAMQSGMEVRPLSAAEITAHLAAFGIGEELAQSKIRGFSGGQKSRLVMAAAMWNKPHLLALDEPTNYLDRESLAALAAALRAFAGAVLVVSHSAAFVDALCSERWRVEGGEVVVLKERRGIED